MKVTAALLAGGKSTRMGRDKCLILVAGIPMWQRQLDLLSSLSAEVCVVAPRRPEWLPPTVAWVADAVPDQGPIGGLAAVLAQARSQNVLKNVLVLAVDMPAMSAGFLQQMIALANHDQDGDRGIVPQIGDSFEPLCAIYPSRALPVVNDQLLVKKNNSLQTLLRRLIQADLMRSFNVTAADLGLFRNMNLPSDCPP